MLRTSPGCGQSVRLLATLKAKYALTGRLHLVYFKLKEVNEITSIKFELQATQQLFESLEDRHSFKKQSPVRQLLLQDFQATVLRVGSHRPQHVHSQRL